MSTLPIRAEFTAAGALARLFAGELSLLQYPASELEAGPHQVWLRRRGADGCEAVPLTGPTAGARIAGLPTAPVLRGSRWGVSLWCLSSCDGWSWLVVGPVAEHGVEDIDASSG